MKYQCFFFMCAFAGFTLLASCGLLSVSRLEGPNYEGSTVTDKTYAQDVVVFTNAWYFLMASHDYFPVRYALPQLGNTPTDISGSTINEVYVRFANLENDALEVRVSLSLDGQSIYEESLETPIEANRGQPYLWLRSGAGDFTAFVLGAQSDLRLRITDDRGREIIDALW